MKAIKLVAGVAIAAVGVVTGNPLLISAGVATAASGVQTLLAPKPQTTSSQAGRLTTSLDPRAMRKTALGTTALANDLRYEEWFGGQQDYCGWIVALASHRIESLDAIWINQELAWSATAGVAAKFQGYFFVQHIVKEGGPGQTFAVSSPDAGKWNGSSRLTGCAYVHIQFRVTGIDKATSPFSGGLPSRITFIGRGGLLYDPRRDDTVPGGAGPMRAGDQSTWRFIADDGAEIGNNLPLQILRVLLGWTITNPATGVQKLAVGCGLPSRRIDMASFIGAANIADELANRRTGGTEPKFHGGAVLSEGDAAHAQLDMLLAACNGRLRDQNGKLALAIMHNDLAGAATDDGLSDDDVIGGFTWSSDPPLDQCVNVVRGKFTDPSTTSLYQMIDYPDAALPSLDGIDRVMTLDLSVVHSASHAQRVAKQVLERRQYQRTFTAPFDIRAWKYQLGDVVPFTFSALSFDRRLFRVSAQELGQDGQCVMSLMDENAALYAWDASDAPPVTAAEPIVYDPTKSPLILAVGEAAKTAQWPNVTDPAGTRPEDNATNSANLDSPFGHGTVRQVVEVLAKTSDIFELPKVVGAIGLAQAATRDSLAEQALVGLLLDERAVRGANDAVAAARQEITQKIRDDGAAEATARLTLAASVDWVGAALVVEQQARSDGIAAQARVSDTLTARVSSVQADMSAVRQATVDLAAQKASTSDLTAAISTVNGNIAAAVHQVETTSDGKYAAASSLDALNARLNQAGGSGVSVEAALSTSRSAIGDLQSGKASASDVTTLQAQVGGAGGLTAQVTSLRDATATLVGKAKARFEEVASVGGAVAGVRAIVELSDGTLTSNLALVAQAVGIWIDRGDGVLVRLAYFQDGRVMIAGALEANSVTTGMLNGNAVTVRREAETTADVAGSGSTLATVCTVAFALARDADAIVSISGHHAYSGSVPDFGVEIVTDDGRVIEGPSGGASTVTTNFAMTRKISMAAGSGRSLSLRWRGGSSDIALKAGASIVVDAAMA